MSGVGGGLLLHPSCARPRMGAPRNTQRTHPSQASILEKTAPCDLIPAQAVGQEGSCNAHFPCTKTREEGDTPQAKVWQPEPKVMPGRTLH